MRRYALLGLGIMVLSVVMGLISMYTTYEEEFLYTRTLRGPSTISLSFEDPYNVLRLSADHVFSYRIVGRNLQLQGKNVTYEGVFSYGNYTLTVGQPDNMSVSLQVSRLKVEHPYILLSIPAFFLLFVGMGFSLRILGTILKGE